jgi:hypothetical protein
VMDPDDHLFIVAGSDGLFYYNLSIPTATNITYQTVSTTSGSGASCAGMVNGWAGNNGQYPGLAWDPIGKVVVGYPNGGNVLYLLNPKTWTCSTTVPSGKTPGIDYPFNTPGTDPSQTNFSGADGTFGHFRYSGAASDIFILCNQVNQDCWYFVPNRTPLPLSACDVNKDRVTNVADVQLEVNMALGISPCTNSSTTCNVISVQRVVNAALGGACVAP